MLARDIYPSRLLHGRTLAYKSNSFRRAKFKERWPFPTGVIRGPFNPIWFRLTESIADCGIPNRPSGFLTGVTSTLSHSMGTLAAANIFCTAAEISGPIPSPGINVTFLTPPEAKLRAPIGVDAYKYNTEWIKILESISIHVCFVRQLHMQRASTDNNINKMIFFIT